MAGNSVMVSFRACRGMEVCRSTHPLSENTQVKSASEGAFYSNAFGLCFTTAQTQSPRQGSVLCLC